MELTSREIWGLIHGILLGSLFLLSYSGSIVWLRSYSMDLLSEKGKRVRAKRMVTFIWGICIVCWVTLLVGTLIIYPWYRAVPVEGADLVNFPQKYLLSTSKTAGWHKYGMEWKEHIAWLSPFIFTAVAYIATLYKELIADNRFLRHGLMLLITIGFVMAGVAALLGALITKKAPL